MSHATQARDVPAWGDATPAILTLDDLAVVLDVLAEVAPRWSAELHQSCADESTIVVMPEGANDVIGPSFVLHRLAGRVRLDQFRWDEYRKLGSFASLDAALAMMRVRLIPLRMGGRLLDR